MVVNFRARGISRGVRKLARTLTLIKKEKKESELLVSQVKREFREMLSFMEQISSCLLEALSV
jgi:hypothetical protein